MSRKKTESNTQLLLFESDSKVFKKAPKHKCPVCKKACKFYQVLMKRKFTEAERDKFLETKHKDPCPRCKEYIRFNSTTKECARCRHRREDVERIEREYLANPGACDSIIRIFASKYNIPVMKIYRMLEDQVFYREVVGYELK